MIAPATGQGQAEWQAFLSFFKADPRSAEYDWLLYEHGIRGRTWGTARSYANELASCIEEKANNKSYASITLIGHSIGGMLIRRAYLQAAGAFRDVPAATSAWAGKVDRILLFSSVNRGVRKDFMFGSTLLYGALGIVPHPRFVLEDMNMGSDFIADTRIAWIRLFGQLRNELPEDTPNLPRPVPPHVVQFWGTRDSVVRADDNADLEAFSGAVLQQVTGAVHGNLQRLERNFTDDPEARWSVFRKQLFDPPQPSGYRQHRKRKVLVVLRGIRDSTGSDWVTYFEQRGLNNYDHVEAPQYGYMSAAEFARASVRAEHIPEFRDRYAQLLAENPLTEFDFIGHSNGTYILGHSLASTPSMRFNNVVLAAPVLPTDFDWNTLLSRKQVGRVRYDTAASDWAVGILCPLLRAIGFSDVGPSGVVLFGEGRMYGNEFIKRVGWYAGGHGAALRYDPAQNVDNRFHLLQFAIAGVDQSAGEPLREEPGLMQMFSRATRWLTLTVILLLGAWIIYRYRSGRPIRFRSFLVAGGVLAILYAILDVV